MERKYIWLNDSQETAYVEFRDEFEYVGGETTLKITADFKYAVFVNGRFVGNCTFPDIPEYKTFCIYDITGFLQKGKNILNIKAYHMDEERNQCRKMPVCISYEITSGDGVLAVSSEKTLCRKETHYLPCEDFTWQLGYGYEYSFLAEETPWREACVVQPNFKEVERPIQNTYLKSEKECFISAQGVYKENGGETTAEIMQRAWLMSLPFSQMDGACAEEKVLPLIFQSKEDADGMFIMGDLGCECAGYPYFTVECEEDTTAYLGWGEHISDLRVRTKIGGDRNFAIKLYLKKGVNNFNEYLRRLGCRYLCLYVRGTKKVTLHRFGLREELYPLKKPAKDFGDELLNKIYETGRRTLELCMHDRYEDCPWREQAMYGMDSRNQMLFGYGAFEEYQFPRVMLSLFAKCITEDDVVPLFPPAIGGAIPSFSLYWVLAVCENARADYDESFIKETLPFVERVLRRFMRSQKGGVICSLEKYWNFHEWSEGLADITGGKLDGLLTALTYRAIVDAIALEEKIGNKQAVEELTGYASTLSKGFEKFYNSEKKLFASFIEESGLAGYHEFTNAMFLSTGILNEEQRKSVKYHLTNETGELVKITLAALPIKYEALLKDDKETFEYIKRDICKIFGGMLFQGATSYWETERGDSDFQNAGSLCHGWSAAACWVLDTYCKNLAI